jgi:hypothetical protein
MNNSSNSIDIKGGYQPTFSPNLHKGYREMNNQNQTADAHRSSPLTPTRVASATNPSRQNTPHYTGKNDQHYISTLCRCANPASHGDAWSRRKFLQEHKGKHVLDIHGQPITWSEAQHRVLDALGKDSATTKEQQDVMHLVFEPEHVEYVLRYHRLREAGEAGEANRMRFWVESDVIWHGRVNPHGFLIMPVESLRAAHGPGAMARFERPTISRRQLGTRWIGRR